MKTLFLFFFLLFFVSCNNDDDNRSEFQSVDVTFSEIGNGVLFGNGSENITQSNILINNHIDWQNLMTQMNTNNNVTNSFTETDIDYDAYSIVAIFLEIKPTAWQVEITIITENENSITVSIQETEFDNTIITQPFHIVKIPKTDKPIVLE